MKYSLILHVASRQWMIGKIVNHQAIPLSEIEAKKLCERLNKEAESETPNYHCNPDKSLCPSTQLSTES